MAHDVVVDEAVEGKRVLNEDGEEIGVVATVLEGTAYVDPAPGVAETISSTFGWSDVEEDDYPLPAGSIERITDEEVHVRSEF